MARGLSRARTPSPHQLLVEGNDDQHVVWQLCAQHELPESFRVVTPGDRAEVGGISEVLRDIPVRLRQETIRTLGIVVDANGDPAARWASVCATLPEPFQGATPTTPVPDGWISEPIQYLGNLLRIGIWLMPNDIAHGGALEDFALQLIPAGDRLLAKARTTLIEVEQLQGSEEQRHSITHRSKALIHTWLAWQRNPGLPMGTAMKAGYLRHDAPLALTFIAWLQRLFAPTSTASEVA
jgi:hypothetical protein